MRVLPQPVLERMHGGEEERSDERGRDADDGAEGDQPEIRPAGGRAVRHGVVPVVSVGGRTVTVRSTVVVTEVVVVGTLTVTSVLFAPVVTVLACVTVLVLLSLALARSTPAPTPIARAMTAASTTPHGLRCPLGGGGCCHASDGGGGAGVPRLASLDDRRVSAPHPRRVTRDQPKRGLRSRLA
jgi:hypothetical protein